MYVFKCMYVRGGVQCRGWVREWLVGWLVGLALVCAFVCAFVSACVLSWVEIYSRADPFAK